LIVITLLKFGGIGITGGTNQTSYSNKTCKGCTATVFNLSIVSRLLGSANNVLYVRSQPPLGKMFNA
jgi:hypothetical protein